MNISKILPNLLKLQQPKNNASQQAAKDSFANQEVLKNLHTMKTASSIVKDTGVKDQDLLQQNRPAGQIEITYLPLPLKSEQFKSAMFFVRQYSGNKPINDGESSAFFIKLDTYNLGVLWIGLEHLPQQGLGVRFITEKESFRQTITEILPGIRRDLEQLNCGNISTTCHVQPKVRHCQDIDPSAAGAAVITSLMDWQV